MGTGLRRRFGCGEVPETIKCTRNGTMHVLERFVSRKRCIGQTPKGYAFRIKLQANKWSGPPPLGKSIRADVRDAVFPARDSSLSTEVQALHFFSFVLS
jgi:hypothetical protein